MRTRIALAAATAATFIMGSTLSLSQHSAAAPAGATKYDTVNDTLAAFHETDPTSHGTTDLKPLTNALLAPNSELFGVTTATSGSHGTGASSATAATSSDNARRRQRRRRPGTGAGTTTAAAADRRDEHGHRRLAVHPRARVGR